MKLPESVTCVTGFSKLLALLLILAFLLSAFFLGMMYQKQVAEIAAEVTPMPTPVPLSQVMCATDSDCLLTSQDTKDSCCPNTKCLNLSDKTTVAVSAKWLTQEKTSVCGTKHMCIMIAAICAKDVMEENTHYSAKCIQHVCQKVRS